MLLKLLFSVCLMFTVATAINSSVNKGNCTFDTFKFYLPYYVVPLHYDILLKLVNDTFFGESSVQIKMQEPTKEISLHTDDLQIDDDISLIPFSIRGKTKMKPKEYKYCRQTQILVLLFSDEIVPGKYSLNMKFNGSLLSSKGFFAVKYMGKEMQIRESYVMLFEPTGARSAFPCWDEPTWKSTYNFTLIFPDKHEIFSNMPIMEEKFVESGQIQTSFQITPNMPLQYLTIVIVDIQNDYTSYNHEIAPNTFFNVWCAEDRKDHIEEMHTVIVPTIANFITKNMGFTWKISTLNIMMFPYLPIKFAGSWELAVVREKDVIGKEQDIGRKLAIYRTLAHSIIRQFIETFASKNICYPLWLKKAVALYFSYYIIQKSTVYNDTIELFVVQVLQPALRNNIELNVPRTKEKNDLFYNNLIFNRASALIRMLQHIIQDKLLNQGLVEFFQIFNLCTSNDLWQLLQHKISATRQQYNIEDVMFFWTSQEKHPILTVTRNGKTDGTQSSQYVNISQKNDACRVWQIPLTYTTQSELNFWDTSPRLWLKESVGQLDGIHQNDWVIFNVQQTGFYRVIYDDDNWFKIVNYLNEENHTNIHRLNRAQLIDDAYHFMMMKELKQEIFLKLINYLWKEHDYIPWHAMLNVLKYTSPFFNFPESGPFKNHLMKIFTKYLEAYEYNHHALEFTSLPMLHWACKLGNLKCKKIAHTILIQHLQNSTQNPIKPGWEEWIYCAGLMNANLSIWTKVSSNIVLEKDKELIKYLTCSENVNILKYFMYPFIFDEKGKWSSLSNRQMRSIYRDIIRKHARKDEVLNFVLTNFKGLQQLERPRDINVRFGSVIMNVYSDCQLDKIWDFAENQYSSNFETLHAVDRMIEIRRYQLKRQKRKFLDAFLVLEYNEKCVNYLD